MVDDPSKKTEGTSKPNATEAAKLLNTIRKEDEIAADREQKARELLLQTETQLQQTYKESLDLLKQKEKSTEAIRENSKGLADSEQIIAEAQEKHLEAIKEQYLIRQKAFVLAVEEIRELKEKQKTSFGLTQQEIERLKLLEEKILPKLKDQTSELGKQIENIKKRQEAETQILSIGKEIYGFLVKQEQVMVNLYKLTGGANKEIAEASKLINANTLASGVTIEQGQQALTNLATGFNNLRAYGAQAAAAMGTTVAYMEKVGISGASATKSMDTLVNAMGKTPQQAHAIQESFVQMSAKNKMALNTITEAFAQNSSRFVGYGAEMTKVLDGLAEQAMKTGLKIEQLINIAQGFDTFEDAARKAGTLNAMLGDQFNAIELLTASDEERIKLLQDGVRASGLQWESMDRFQKMAIANAAGIKDLNEAAKLFGNTLSKNTALEQESAAAKKTLEEHALETSVSMDKLQSSLNGLMVAITPLLTGIMKFTTLLAELLGGIHSALSNKIGPTASAFIISFTILLISKFSLIGRAFTYLGGKISWFGKLLGTTTAGAPNPAAAQSFSNSARGIARGITSFFSTLANNFGRVLLGILVAGLIGAVIVALVVGLKKMADLDGPKILAGLGLLTAIFIGIMVLGALMNGPLGLVFAAGIAGFLALAAVLAIMGGALIIMSTGLQGIADAFTKLKAATDNFGTTATSIEQFVSSLLDMNLDGIDDLSKSILKLAESIKELNSATSAMGALKDFETKMTSLINFSVSGNATNTSVGASLTSVSGLSPQIPNNTTIANKAQSINQQGTTVPVYVPVVINLNGQKIGEILDPKIRKVASDEAFTTLQLAGITTSAERAGALQPIEEIGR